MTILWRILESYWFGQTRLEHPVAIKFHDQLLDYVVVRVVCRRLFRGREFVTAPPAGVLLVDPSLRISVLQTTLTILLFQILDPPYSTKQF